MTDDDRADFEATFPEIVSVPVQWGDQDAFGHVNNTIYLRWFEIGRIAYFRRIGMDHTVTSLEKAPILASVTCDFRFPLTFPDRIHVGTRVVRVGNTSLVLEHAILSDLRPGRAAEGRSTVVYFDYVIGKPCVLTGGLRTAISQLESADRS